MTCRLVGPIRPTVPANRTKVEAALAREAAKFDGRHRGVHRFMPIWEADERPGCNWTTTFRVTGSGLELNEMGEALERVQAEFPLVKFD